MKKNKIILAVFTSRVRMSCLHGQIEIGLFVNGRQSLKDEMDCQGANAEGKDKEIAFLSRTRPIQTVRALHLPQIMR